MKYKVRFSSGGDSGGGHYGGDVGCGKGRVVDDWLRDSSVVGIICSLPFWIFRFYLLDVIKSKS